MVSEVWTETLVWCISNINLNSEQVKYSCKNKILLCILQLEHGKVHTIKFDPSIKQDRQCTYVTYRHIHVATVTVEKQVAVNIVCVCSYPSIPGCISHLFCATLYCHLWAVWLYHIFPHYLRSGTNFGQKKK